MTDPIMTYSKTCGYNRLFRLADNDVILTTYAIVGKEIGIPEGMKNNKEAQEMPVEDKVCHLLKCIAFSKVGEAMIADVV